MTEAQLTFDGDTDVTIRRSFSHPPAKVWRALTEPSLIRQWLSPDLTGCEMDARPGGSFRYDWPEFFFSGPVLEVSAPHRMVHVEHFNGDTTQGPTVTTTLTADRPGTRMTVVMRCVSTPLLAMLCSRSIFTSSKYGQQGWPRPQGWLRS